MAHQFVWRVIGDGGEEMPFVSNHERRFFTNCLMSAIRSFLNNNWTGRSSTSETNRVLTYWTCGEIPYGEF